MSAVVYAILEMLGPGYRVYLVCSRLQVTFRL